MSKGNFPAKTFIRLQENGDAYTPVTQADTPVCTNVPLWMFSLRKCGKWGGCASG